ncbi:MAG: hypothetical protein WCL51_17825 [Bacteroidota bacterium]
MIKVIWKYELKIKDVQDIEIPSGSILLSIQSQENHPMLWALVDETNKEKEIIRLRTICTGEEIMEEDFNPKDYLGTYQLNEGLFVGHVFQVTL